MHLVCVVNVACVRYSMGGACAGSFDASSPLDVHQTLRGRLAKKCIIHNIVGQAYVSGRGRPGIPDPIQVVKNV